jgi:hypothetical protein
LDEFCHWAVVVRSHDIVRTFFAIFLGNSQKVCTMS